MNKEQFLELHKELGQKLDMVVSLSYKGMKIWPSYDQMSKFIQKHGELGVETMIQTYNEGIDYVDAWLSTEGCVHRHAKAEDYSRSYNKRYWVIILKSELVVLIKSDYLMLVNSKCQNVNNLLTT